MRPVTRNLFLRCWSNGEGAGVNYRIGTRSLEEEAIERNGLRALAGSQRGSMNGR